MSNAFLFIDNRKTISSRFRFITFILFSFTVLLIAVIAIITIIRIDREASLDRINAEALKIADSFRAYISEDLILVRKASKSIAITEWFADYANPSKKYLAYGEMMDYAALFQRMYLNFGINESQHEYAIERSQPFENFVHRGILDPNLEGDSWYFETIAYKTEYNLKFDSEKVSGLWYLWINHKVISDGKVTGVFSSGLQIDPLLRGMFDDLHTKKMKGYIIDEKGIVLLSSNYAENDKRMATGEVCRVTEKNNEANFTAALNEYLTGVNDFFTPFAESKTISLSKGDFHYASITPIVGTDWSVVLFYENSIFSGILNFLPLFLIFLLALFVFLTGQSMLVNRLFFSPIKHITEDFAANRSKIEKVFGSDREDEIGVLARTIQDTVHEIKQRDDMLSAANLAADLLLMAEKEENISSSVLISMEHIGHCLDADRVHIWRNETKEGEPCYVHQNEWLNQSGGFKPIPSDTTIYYKDRPGWRGTLSTGGCINGPVSKMTQSHRTIFNPNEIKSVLIVPLFIQNDFWGLFSIDDCRNERTFSSDEINILRSVGLMIGYSILREKLYRDIQDTAAKLEAVISNYSGIIWSVDSKNNITLLSGVGLERLEIAPKVFEGWNIDEARKENPNLDIISKVQKTFDEGPQDWIMNAGGRMVHAHTTPIFDAGGVASGVVGNINDITEIMELQEKLEAALKKAQEADHTKSEFLAKMSHEMRTPLNAIIGLSGLALDGSELGDNSRPDIEKVYNAGSLLLSTVNDILDISKIEAGKLELVEVEYDVSSLLNDTITQSIVFIEDKPLQLILEISENIPSRLLGDELRIKQVFNNLLSNAFKYTREGSVTLGVNCENKSGDTVMMNVYIKDTGIGIKPEDINVIFDEYRQADTRANHHILGTGLGMPITKKVVELMGGSIKVESEYGKGSVFSLTIPHKFVTNTVIGKEVVENLKGHHYIDGKRRKNKSLKKINLSYARVLVVDDIPTNLDVARGLMKPYGLQVDCLSSARGAVDAVREGKIKYNAIFMDHMMPDMDGIVAAQLIRQIDTEYAKNVPIIALTANAIVGNKEMFLSKGFQDFLSKPVEVSKLDAVLKKWIRNEEQEKLLPAQNPAQDEEEDSFTEADNEQEKFLLSEKIDGLDFDKGMKIFSGHAEPYITLLHTFAASTPQLLDSSKSVNEENLDAYRITVHGIKGSGRSIGAERVADMAEALEKAAKNEDYNFIELNNGPFQEVARKLISDIDAMLSKIDVQKPKKDKPDNAELARLQSACARYNVKEAKLIMAGLSNYEYESGSDLVDWLKENVRQLNYQQIVERLSPMLSTAEETGKGGADEH